MTVSAKMQDKQPEWLYQWERFKDDQAFLFWDWIWPRTQADFEGARVLDAGCGPGHHMRLVAQYADHVVGLDLNTAELARQTLADLDNVELVEGDIVLHEPEEKFDVVYSIGVIDHTDSPDASFESLKRMTKPGGLTMVWVWSEEGNALMQNLVEPMRRTFLKDRSRNTVEGVARFLTATMYPAVYSVYMLPLPFLPYYDYFRNFRKLSFERNTLNTFDKLNAPYTEFISYERARRWFNDQDYEDISITQYKGVSWRASGRKRAE